mgnify:CR=1 FL=1
MQAQYRLLTRTLFEIVFIVAGWVLLIASIISLVGGAQTAAGWLFLGCVVAFASHAISFKTKSSASYISEAQREGER